MCVAQQFSLLLITCTHDSFLKLHQTGVLAAPELSDAGHSTSNWWEVYSEGLNLGPQELSTRGTNTIGYDISWSSSS